MKFIGLEYDNNKLTNSELKSHQEIINEYEEKGYRYHSFILVSFGPSGKALAVDLVFDEK